MFLKDICNNAKKINFIHRVFIRELQIMSFFVYSSLVYFFVQFIKSCKYVKVEKEVSVNKFNGESIIKFCCAS